jgi:uncharacterized protein YabE (DUF348 family)
MPMTVLRLMIAAVLALASALAVLPGRAVAVTLQCEGRPLHRRTTAATVTALLRQARVRLSPADEVEPPPAARLTTGTTIRVRRSAPVTVTADGKTVTIQSARPTAAALLAQMGLVVGPLDRVLPAPSAPLEKDLAVRLIRVTERFVTERRDVPFERIERDDYALAIGLFRTVRRGEPGLVEADIRLIYEDGVSAGSEVVARRVVREPVSELVAVGTSGVISRGGATIRFSKAMTMEATAYYPGPLSTWPYTDGYTAIGMKATYGVVAVDPRVIPLRTRLYIDGYGYAIAGDVGGAIKGNKIDLCFDTYEEAMRWGRRPVDVYILP